METMAPVKSMDGRPLAHIAVAVAAAVLALFLLNRFVTPVPIFGGISADQAVVIAREFAVAGQASNELIREVRTALRPSPGRAGESRSICPSSMGLRLAQRPIPRCRRHGSTTRSTSTAHQARRPFMCRADWPRQM
jgi:hypothetical protein